ncbi:MAG: flagellar protein FlaG [Woeseiaceae bacterium]
MSDQELKPAGNATGTFAVVRPAVAEAPETGKPAPAPGKEVPVRALDASDLEALAVKLNIQSQSIGRDLRFKVDIASGQSIIQVLDRETGEIIREIPPEQAEFRLSANGGLQLRLFNGRA